VPLQKDSWIGVTTHRDTIKYWGDKTYSYYIVHTGKLDGCIGYLLVPGLNIRWLLDVKNRQEKPLNRTKWGIRIEKVSTYKDIPGYFTSYGLKNVTYT
jgi:hypothetical protein